MPRYLIPELFPSLSFAPDGVPAGSIAGVAPDGIGSGDDEDDGEDGEGEDARDKGGRTLRMTQAEFDAKIDERLKRQRNAYIRELGESDPKKLRARLAELEGTAAQLKRKAATDQERALIDAREEGANAAREQLSAEVEKYRAMARSATIEREIILKAAGRFRDDAIDLVIAQAGKVVEFDPDTGEVMGVSDALKEIEEKRPYLLSDADADRPPPRANNAPTLGGNTAPTGRAAARGSALKTVLSKYPGPRQRDAG